MARELPPKSFTSYKNKLSSGTMSIQCGVPQGSILGPLLFLIFINDIDSKLKHCKVRLYADDTAIYTKENDIKMAHDRIQQYLNGAPETSFQ